MSENSIPHTLSSFLSDLVEIREKNGVTLDDIRVRTKVYPHIIAQFEKDGLKEHPLFNVLYLKAFVRSYAEVVGVSPSIAVHSYVAALDGRYERQLAVKYLGLPPQAESVLEVVPQGRERVRSHPDLVSSEEVSNIETRSTGGEKKRVNLDQRGSAKAVEIKESITEFFSELGSRSVNVMQLIGGKGILQWGVLGACIFVGAFLLIRLVSSQNESRAPLASQEQSSAIQETSVTQDTEEIEALSPADSLVIEKANLIQSIIDRIEDGDSLSITVVAAYNKLDPFRIKVDRDLRRPYWIDEGDSLKFWFNDQIVVEDNLDKMMILFESLPYPIIETDSTAKVVISRDSANSFLYSSLR